MTNEVFLDPVDDGAPAAHTRVEVALIALFIGVAGLEVYTGRYAHAFDSVTIGVLLYLYDKSRRVNWQAGYYAAVETIVEQAELGSVEDE